jgi:GT2 family glycosyltransferase
LARGAYIAFLDVDDAWSPDKLLSQSGYLLSHPGVDIVQGLIQEELLAEQASAGRVRAARPYYFVNLGSMLFRRSVFEVVGLFDENLQFNEDTDWLFRAWELSVPKAVVHEVVLYYRLHDTNMTRWDNARHSGLVELMKRHRDRLRARDRTRFHPHNNAENLAVYLGWTDIAAAKGLLPDRPGQPSGAE